MSSFKLSFSRAIALLGLLGLGLTQVGCAHSVVEPSVSVHSRIGHFPVYSQVGVPGSVYYGPQPRVIYAPPPPPHAVRGAMRSRPPIPIPGPCQVRHSYAKASALNLYASPCL